MFELDNISGIWTHAKEIASIFKMNLGWAKDIILVKYYIISQRNEFENFKFVLKRLIWKLQILDFQKVYFTF